MRVRRRLPEPFRMPDGRRVAVQDIATGPTLMRCRLFAIHGYYLWRAGYRLDRRCQMAYLVGEVARLAIIPIGLYRKHIPDACRQPLYCILGHRMHVYHLRVPIRARGIGGAIIDFVARDFGGGVWGI